MPLPDMVPVKYTEEEAEYVSIRPVVQQQFRGDELVDMIVRVTGKDVARVRQILRTGTVVFHSYRYWWAALDADERQVRELLAKYPDADSSRPFRPESCTEVILEPGGPPGSHALHFDRKKASKRRFLRSRSFWDCLMALAEETPPTYREYSYALGTDVYSAPLSTEQIRRLGVAAHRYAPRRAQTWAATFSAISQVVYACAR
ncbi:MAG TPA: hypothetical protein VEJ67_11620 [Candidatus Cybelea sp.]|nr:hypothetical protein [Candidatus Cybelea sp.]